LANLVLLGGPPGVGKSSVCKRLSDGGWTHVEADAVSPPGEDVARDYAIAKVACHVEAELRASSVVVLSWVFARHELYQPFLKRFTPSHKVDQVYLVSSEKTLKDRLSSRGSQSQMAYSLSRLRLINELPFEKFSVAP